MRKTIKVQYTVRGELPGGCIHGSAPITRRQVRKLLRFKTGAPERFFGGTSTRLIPLSIKSSSLLFDGLCQYRDVSILVIAYKTNKKAKELTMSIRNDHYRNGHVDEHMGYGLFNPCGCEECLICYPVNTPPDKLTVTTNPQEQIKMTTTTTYAVELPWYSSEYPHYSHEGSRVIYVESTHSSLAEAQARVEELRFLSVEASILKVVRHNTTNDSKGWI